MDPQPAPSESPETSGVNIGASGDVAIGGDVAGRDIIKHYYQIVVSPGPAEDDREPPAPGDPPYKGLQYFDERDADHFFGRERLTARIVGRLHQSRFLTIIGASGSGKSSLVRAGVIPALRRGRRLADGSLPPTDSGQWDLRTFTPTVHPLEALAAALAHAEESLTALATLKDDLATEPRALTLAAQKLLARSGKRHLLLFVDQFEEVFTLCRQPAEREAFINQLLAATASPSPAAAPSTAFGSTHPEDAAAGEGRGGGPITILIALRADFYAQCSQHAGLREAISQQQEYIGAMSRDELLSAILQPAALGNWKIQDGLMELMVDEVGGEPGALPLLSHALLETWARRRGRKLTLSGYREAGGIQGAIAQTAESVFQQRLTPAQRPIARMIFLRLTELGASEHAPDTRRPVPFSELLTRATDEPTLEAVLHILTDARLITTDTSPADHTKVVEVAHEAIIREWPTLRQWLNENREGLLRHRQLTEDAQEWEKLGRDAGALYRGVRLKQTLEWAERFPEPLSLLETEFLQASRENAAQEAAEAERLRRAAGMQRAFAVVALASVLAVIGLLGYWLAVNLAPAQPGRMNGQFNLAVAEFAQVDVDGKVITPTTEAGRQLSLWTYEQVGRDLQGDPSLLIWHDEAAATSQANATIGVVADGQEGVETPEALAQRLNADAVIYGRITPLANGFAELELKFFVAEQLERDLATIGGEYRVGEPIRFRLADPGLEVRGPLSEQVNRMTQITLGLNYTLVGRHTDAIAAYERAAAASPDSEVVQFLLGQEHLFQAQADVEREQNEQAAQAYFERSIQLNPDYLRGYIGLGSVYFVRAQRRLEATYSDHYTGDKVEAYRDTLALVEPAIKNYALAAAALALSGADRELSEADLRDLAGPGEITPRGGADTDSVLLSNAARIALGMSYRLKAEATYYLGDAQAAGELIDQALRTLEQALALRPGSQRDYRLVAQAYLALGNVYTLQAALQNDYWVIYQQAIAAYDKCIEQGDLYPIDTFLNDVVIQQYCLPQREALKAQYGGGS